MSRKRARRSARPSVASSSDAPTMQYVPKPALRLPIELIYTILAMSMGDYLSEIMLECPPVADDWDATLTFLHVSRSFRSCTIKLLYHLWGDTFIHERTSALSNYKPTYATFRRLTRLARTKPLSFSAGAAHEKPRELSARAVRHPISPLARIWAALVRNTAAANAVLADADNDRVHVDFEDVYVAEDLQVVAESYAEVPAGVRALLLGRVMHCTMTQAAIWTKLKALSATVTSVFRFLTLLLEAGGQLELRAELPEITEDAVAQVSRDKHASLADVFSLAVEDIPPMLAKHAVAVGLDMVLFLLELVESEGNAYVELCQMMRSYIASYLTESEREHYLQ